jgi:hypothetical protein
MPKLTIRYTLMYRNGLAVLLYLVADTIQLFGDLFKHGWSRFADVTQYEQKLVCSICAVSSNRSQLLLFRGLC